MYQLTQYKASQLQTLARYGDANTPGELKKQNVESATPADTTTRFFCTFTLPKYSVAVCGNRKSRTKEFILLSALKSCQIVFFIRQVNNT
jgi:hypothetical protein